METLYYATIDANGHTTGFYNSEAHGEGIPEVAVEIPFDKWEAELNGDRQKWTGTAWVADPIPAIPDSELAAKELKFSDPDLIRIIEDIYNVLTPEQKASMPQSARDKIANRQVIRGRI